MPEGSSYSWCLCSYRVADGLRRASRRVSSWVDWNFWRPGWVLDMKYQTCSGHLGKNWSLRALWASSFQEKNIMIIGRLTKVTGCPLMISCPMTSYDVISFVTSLPAMSFGGRFCVSRNDGTGGSPEGWKKRDCVWACRKPWLAISVLFGINRLGYQLSHLVVPPRPASKAFLFS